MTLKYWADVIVPLMSKYKIALEVVCNEDPASPPDSSGAAEGFMKTRVEGSVGIELPKTVKN